MYFWFFGKFLVKYEIYFIARGDVIAVSIDTTSIDAIVTYFFPS